MLLNPCKYNVSCENNMKKRNKLEFIGIPLIYPDYIYLLPKALRIFLSEAYTYTNGLMLLKILHI